MSNQEQQQLNVFIPFIESGIKSPFIKKVFLEKSLGKIISIELHDKKIVEQGKLTSANHYYAFITIIPFDSIIGKNLIKNVKNNHTTRVYYGKSGCWEVKQHLTRETRVKKGFNIIQPSLKKKCETQIESPISNKRINNNKYSSLSEDSDLEEGEITEWDDYPLDTKFEFRALPKEEDDEEEEDEEEEEETVIIPEWYDYQVGTKFGFKEIPDEFPFLDVCDILSIKPSIFQNTIERLEIDNDYNDIQQSLSEYSLWNNNNFTLPIY